MVGNAAYAFSTKERARGQPSGQGPRNEYKVTKINNMKTLLILFLLTIPFKTITQSSPNLASQIQISVHMTKKIKCDKITFPVNNDTTVATKLP